MARHPNQLQEPAQMLEILPARAADIVNAQDALALATQETDARVSALALQIGYDGPLTADAVENCIGLYRQRSAEAVLGLGKSILLLKEMVPHGEFSERLARQNLENRTAQRLMNVAVKFGKSDNLSLLKAAGNQAKLLELTVLDDEEIELLGNGGSVRGLDQDDIARMGFKELRAALREAKAEAKANQEILDKKNAKIDKLERDKKRVQAEAPDEALAQLLREVSDLGEKAVGTIQGGLRKGFEALFEHHATNGGDSRQIMAGYVAQLQEVLNALRDAYNLPDTVGDGTPAWQRWADAQDAADGTVSTEPPIGSPESWKKLDGAFGATPAKPETN
jgi:hypothetical protein